MFILHGQKQEELVDVFRDRGQAAAWRNTLGLLFGDLIDTFKPHAGVECLRALAKRIELPPLETSRRGESGGEWNQAILFGDCLQILVGRESAIPEDLRSFFEQCVYRAIDQEIAVKDRQTMVVTLGRLGDPRVESDLRVAALRVAAIRDEHPAYVAVPAGNYVIGDERRVETIKKPFWITKHPVTHSQYALFVNEGGYARREWWSKEGWKWVQDRSVSEPSYWQNQEFNGPNQPVVGVSWWEADAFCRWAGGLLPTERQWEAAACGPAGFEYPWGDDWEDGVCNSREAGLGGTSAVGIFPRGRSAAFGVEDMAGNVWEWCSDAHGSGRAYRGGSWLYAAWCCRSAYRYGRAPEDRSYSLGFRLALVPVGGAASKKPEEAEPRAEAEGATD